MIRRPILLTGATGFLGRHVVRELLAAGAAPIIVYRNPESFEAAFPHYAGRSLRWDLDTDWTGERADAVADAEVAVHMAGHVTTTGSFSDEDTLRHNVLPGMRFLHAIPERCKHLVCVSSTAVYGRPQTSPIDETHPTNPSELYGIAKLTLEKLYKLYGRERKIAVTILRTSAVYGPGMPSGRAIARFASALLRGDRPVLNADVHQRRNYIYVGDAARAIVNAIGSEPSATNEFNICAPASSTLMNIADILASELGRNPDWDAPPLGSANEGCDLQYDTSRAARLLDFEATTGLTQGLAETVRWIRKAGHGC